MKENPVHNESTSPKSGPPLRLRIARRVGRLVSILVVLGVFFYSFRSVYRFVDILNTPPPSVVAGSSEKNTAAAFPDAQTLVDPQGGWVFGGSSWTCRRLRFENESFEEKWAGMLAERRQAPPVSGQPDPAAHESLLEMIRFFTDHHPAFLSGTETVRSEEGIIHRRFRLQSVDVSVFTVEPDDESKKERLLEILVSIRDEDDHHQIFGFQRTEEGSSSRAPYRSLLSLPDGARSICARLDRDDAPIFEMIRLDTTAEQLANLWRRDGWAVPRNDHPPHSSSLTAFRTSDTMSRLRQFEMTCSRGGRSIYAWSTDPPDRIQTLFLFCRPSS